jgi:hypothetical protein
VGEWIKVNLWWIIILCAFILFGSGFFAGAIFQGSGDNKNLSDARNLAQSSLEAYQRTKKSEGELRAGIESNERERQAEIQRIIDEVGGYGIGINEVETDIRGSLDLNQKAQGILKR